MYVNEQTNKQKRKICLDNLATKLQWCTCPEISSMNIGRRLKSCTTSAPLKPASSPSLSPFPSKTVNNSSFTFVRTLEASTEKIGVNTFQTLWWSTLVNFLSLCFPQSFPSPLIPSTLFLCRETAPLKLSEGCERCNLPQWCLRLSPITLLLVHLK